ncbi:hypothetical protein BAUCODRAFT_140168 [Baudoinia panamericana UAMH 10762]|uniref:HECT-type E3 ubiquitin transferase n=1 Tax=Baudoinia panamericana (strain UAMH 10762) TaxID=717646 RepID=M2MTR5_BAUPA|nr:uncharacterized protein BAUCODRAFT_140168 [Baudoinia panamericana UAMH 10762]EMC94928.1 hypothetical protein BAUCODRAFT_140168 [Baudoinia panamericana UAMH 10762]
MGRIKKVASERHTATLSPFVDNFVKQAITVPLYELPSKLASFPRHWPFPRGDLYHWIQLLDRFDHVLELFTTEYGLHEGPQTQPFDKRLLQKGDAEDGLPYPSRGGQPQELDALGYSEEGDETLVKSVLQFTRLLLEHCGNRSLYASSGHISDLLNTTSLSLLRLSLKLALRLAQRYQVARMKAGSPHAQPGLMANHYNFNLDNLHKLAMPFAKPTQTGLNKGKEKALASSAFNPADLVSIAKEPASLALKGDLGAVAVTYYEQALPESRPVTTDSPTEASPTTPTPVRRTSNLGPSRDRDPVADRSMSLNEVPVTPARPREQGASSSAPQVYRMTSDKVASTPTWALVREALVHLPAEVRYEVLNRIRIAKVFASADAPPQQIVEIRLLAIANLGYALNEAKFQEKIGSVDSEEPRRFHLAQQLCDLLQPATDGQIALSLETETTVLLTLEALLKARHRLSEVIDALAITVNHGLIYYELRRVIDTLHAKEDTFTEDNLRELEWREATFDLVNTLQLHNSHARVGERMVTAGVMGILLEVLTLRTTRAERFYERVLLFFAAFIHNIPNALQSFANDKGFDIFADLAQYEVEAALKDAGSGNGLRSDFKAKVIDYNIPYHRQATLRQLFKLTVQLFESNAGTHDRLLRNLIDTPQILSSLKAVIGDSKTFGSNVWSGAVNIMSAFIHNEPTSYQVVGEAGLPRALLEAIVGHKLPEEIPSDTTRSESDIPPPIEFEDGEPVWPNVEGILPVGETMVDIPTAFGAICLNENGMNFFKASNALTKYFDIFVSPPHVKALEEEVNVPSNIGQAFDELARHHPRLKQQIATAVNSMVERVAKLNRNLAEYKAIGAKLWRKNSESSAGSDIYVDGGHAALLGVDNQAFAEARESEGRFIPTERTVYTRSEHLKETVGERGDALRYSNVCSKFLEGFFSSNNNNNSMCVSLCEMGGAEHILDLLTSSANPADFSMFGAHRSLLNVLKIMCDAKSHLVLPSVLRRLQNTFTALQPLINGPANPEGLFHTFVDLSKPIPSPLPADLDGTTLLKCLRNAQVLSGALSKLLSPPAYSSRHSAQTNQLFTNLNFTDVYIRLVDDLGKLHANCLWENLALQQTLSPELKDKTDPKCGNVRRLDVNGYIEIMDGSQRPSETQINGVHDGKTLSHELSEQDYAVKNIRNLRFVLDETPKSISQFFHTLGQALAPRRSSHDAPKQHALVVAEHIAKSVLWELEYRKFGDAMDETAELKYIAAALHAVTRVMTKSPFGMTETYGQKEALTLVLHRLYVNDGFTKLNGYLYRFGEVIAATKATESNPRVNAARFGLQGILDFYASVVRYKTIHEAMQTNAMSVRDPTFADYFMPGQFTVELRDAILPAVSKLWNSPAIETMGDQYVKKILDILRQILKGEGEDRAIKRSMMAHRRVQTIQPEFALKNPGSSSSVRNDRVDMQLAREAIYRCNNHELNARDYANLRTPPHSAPRFPIPSGEPPVNGVSEPERPSSQRSVEMTDANGDDSTEAIVDRAATANADAATEPLSEDDDEDDEDDDEDAPINNMPSDIVPSDLASMALGGRNIGDLIDFSSDLPTVGGSAASAAKETLQPYVTIDDLDEKRKALRDALIDRCLEVLSAVPNVTFELADLIQAAVAKSGEAANPRAEIGRTLVSSLMSLTADEPSKESGVKIAAYAHLVALILQDGDFFASTLDELKEYFDALVNWVQLGQDQKAEDTPWLETVLLIMERVLAEDEQPASIEWVPPPADDPLKHLPEPVVYDQVVSSDLRMELFEALINILPKIGKNASLALSVSRILVMLTRRRELAMKLSQKPVIGKLFLMIRQLAGSLDDKLHTCIMLILRHLVEDEHMIRQIMQTEIRATFEGARAARAMDTSTYTRSLYHLVLRDPNIFVEVTKDLVEVARYDGRPSHAQSLTLKKEKPAAPAGPIPSNGEDKSEGNDKASEGVQPSVEGAEVESTGVGEQKPSEAKPPMVESPDGVIAFLLRELSNYREVEDTPTLAPKDSQSAPQTNGESGPDVDMADASSSTPNGSPTPQIATNSKNEKATFKPEEHSIYIYRCFLLRCLSELLSSYNRTKVEFINFSRKPETQPATPVKPRAGTLNYLLHTLIPVGTLEHKDDVGHRKRISTSNLANTVLVSLCAKTPERTRPLRGVELAADEDPDLGFVRKFVLEHALRSFREAITSNEPLDQKYARLLALAELFNCMLNNPERDSQGADFTHKQQIGRIMYEKGFIGALTSAIAELDLNFPNAKRAVKYILGPLRQLTDLGVQFSLTSDVSSSSGPGTSGEDDDISSATSVSEGDEDEREHTPDLLRNTTLGMLESSAAPMHVFTDDEGEDEEDDDDEEMDEYDEYDEEMVFEDEQMPEHGDVVSDEDDDVDGMGDVEGVPGDIPMDVEVIMEEDDDEDDEDMDDDDDDDDDHDEDDADDHFQEHIDEITGDDENASMGEGDEADWEEDEDGNAFEDDAGEGGSPHGGPLEHIAQVIGIDEHSETGEGGRLVRVDIGDGEEEYFEDEMPPEDEDEEAEEGEGDYNGDDLIYEPEIEEDDDEEDLWRSLHPAPMPVIRGGHHHHHHHHHPPVRGFGGMFDMAGADGLRGTLRNLQNLRNRLTALERGLTEPAPTFRSHRTAPTGRTDDDGQNPLLRREGSISVNRDRPDVQQDPLVRMNGRLQRAFPPEELIRDLVNQAGPGRAATINININDLPGGIRGGIPNIFQLPGGIGNRTLIDIDPTRPVRDQLQLAPRFSDWTVGNGANDRSSGMTDEAQAVDFTVTATIVRWQEEAKMVFGGKHHDKATRVVSSLLRVLVPPAMQAKLVYDKAERERKEAEEKAKEEERKKAEAEKAEREAQEKKEREEREAQEREEAAAREQEERQAQTAIELEGAEMEGVEQTQGEAQEATQEETAPPAEPEAPVVRMTTTIRGREVDITNLGIDREFLESIPEDLREEVVMQAIQEHRSQQREQTGTEQPTEISHEFLEALPPEIRQELLRQEASERRRRERHEAQRRAVQEGNAQSAQPEDMSNADVLAMLDPALRQAVLLDQDENTLAMLPEEIQAEARALLGDRFPTRVAGGGGAFRADGNLPRILQEAQRTDQAAREANRQRRPIVQMLDKSGVATLLRLMFVSLHHKAKSSLVSVLADVCRNAQNRADVISTLLTILQDGTGDVAAVERSFTQLSLRAKQVSSQKTPQPLKRTPTGLDITPTTELSPLNIVQHCLSTLNALSSDNNKVPSFFLTEHETPASQKPKTPKKGKGRESKASKYPLNALLTLLDRKIITENTSVMEALASLLSRVTQPLTLLLRRPKEAQLSAGKLDGAAQDGTEQPQATEGDVSMTEAAPAELAAQAAESSAQEQAAPSASMAGSSTEAGNDEAKPEEKKHREMIPPEVPEENIRLVVNILAARECPSKTFSDTLDIIKHLSAIPGAKEVFGKELVRQAQELGQTVLFDLEELANQINSAETSTDLQGLAIANFSSSGSKQRMLLRVLLALDHLFDPNRTPQGTPSAAAIDPKVKEDVLALLYENSTFDKLWSNLTSCLAAIRARGNMVNVATILLPLIESLMVACRNTTLKGVPAATMVTSPIDTSGSTPPPDSRMEALFFRFTEDNRKILNELIRNNPKLMSGNLSILAKNSKVLEFDNKRTYFGRKLHNRGEVRVPHSTLQLSIRRDQVFLDSFKSLYHKRGDEIKYGKLNIRFHGEEGIDAGGVSREWFAAMARQMFNPDYALFNPVASDRTTFHPNPLSDINNEHLMFFKFIGRIIGKALYENRVLDCHFSRAVYRRILGKSVSLKDMESLDLDYYKSLVWILENDITDVFDETFSIDVDRFGAIETVDLIENGRNIPVTEENKQEYVQLVVEHRLIKSVGPQLENFLDGFHDIIPKELVAIFNEQELELLISGLPDIDVDDWKNNTEYHNYQATSSQVQWFWRAVRSFDKEEKAKLLQFVTGTSKVPLNGFKELEGMNGFAKFNIHRDYSSKEKLPSSHTCFNQLDLPEYESYEHLRQQLYTAITAGSEYFGFA